DWRERKAFEKKRDEDFPEDDKPKSRPEGEDATPLPEDGLDFADFAREQAEAAKSGRKPRLRIVELHGAFDLLASRIELTPNGPFDKKLLERLAEFRRERPEEFARLCERYPAVQAAIASLDVIAAGFEDKVALEFSALSANVLRYVADWKKWLQWDGVRWRVENTLHAYDLARVLCRAAKYAAAKRSLPSSATPAPIVGKRRRWSNGTPTYGSSGPPLAPLICAPASSRRRRRWTTSPRSQPLRQATN